MTHCNFKWANSGLPLLILVLFKHKFYRKIVGFRRIRTHSVGVKGEHAENLAPITVQKVRLFCQYDSKILVLTTL